MILVFRDKMGFTLYDSETGMKYCYNKDRVTFGFNDLERAFSCEDETIPLATGERLSYVSRKQIIIQKRNLGENKVSYELLDMSKNGTCINGQKVPGRAANLKSGDLIRLGSKEMDNAIALYFLVNGEADSFIKAFESKHSSSLELMIQPSNPDSETIRVPDLVLPADYHELSQTVPYTLEDKDLKSLNGKK